MWRVLIPAALLLTVASAKSASPRAFVWSRVYGTTVQYGVPDTDNRALRIDCEKGRLSLGGPSNSEAPDGASVPLLLSGQGFSVRRAARISECDGACFKVQVAPDDPAIRTLLAGRPLRIEHAGQTWTVPGNGAPSLLRPLLKACGLIAGA